MVTYSDLFQFGILIVGIISLVIQVNNNKEVTADAPKPRLLLVTLEGPPFTGSALPSSIIIPAFKSLSIPRPQSLPLGEGGTAQP